MGTQRHDSDADSSDDLFEPMLGELADDSFDDNLNHVSTEKQRLLAKRRRAERRLEELRLREELGDYDLEFDDF